MLRRATVVVLATTSIATASGPKWKYAQLVDAPLAPVERSATMTIPKVVAIGAANHDGSRLSSVSPINAGSDKTESKPTVAGPKLVVRSRGLPRDSHHAVVVPKAGSPASEEAIVGGSLIPIAGLRRAGD